MHILLTRPLDDSEELILRFKSLGHKVSHLPVINVDPIVYNEPNYNEFKGIIFTSANAIKNLNTSKINKNIKCFCVGSLTERSLRIKGFNNTVAASGTVNALKNLILNSEKNIKNLAYLCGDFISFELDKELIKEGYKVKKIINYSSKKIIELNDENLDLIKKYFPDVTLIYSQRSAESFNEIVRKYSLLELMTQCKVMCISKKIEEFLKSKGWKKTEIFSPGEELIKIDQIKNG